MSDMILRNPGEGPQYSVAGDLYRFLAGGDQTDGRFSIWHATIPPVADRLPTFTILRTRRFMC